MHTYETNSRGNIVVSYPFREYQIKSIIYDILYDKQCECFSIDICNSYIDEVESVSNWIHEMNCECFVEDAYTLTICKQFN